MTDDKVELGETDKVLPIISERRECTFPAGRRSDFARQPPIVAVAKASGRRPGARNMQGGAFRHPCCRDQLATSPLAVGQHEHAQPRHVSARKEKMIGVVARPLRPVTQHVLPGRVKIFHAERTRKVIREGLEHRPSGEFFVNRSGDVEIPVVVEELTAGLYRPTDRAILAVARTVPKGGRRLKSP